VICHVQVVICHVQVVICHVQVVICHVQVVICHVQVVMSNVQVVMSDAHSPLLQEMCNIRYYRNKKLKNSIKGAGGEVAKSKTVSKGAGVRSQNQKKPGMRS